VDLATIPLFVRAGAILPMGPLKQYTGEKVEGPTDLFIPPGRGWGLFVIRRRRHDVNFKKGAFLRIENRVERRSPQVDHAPGERIASTGPDREKFSRARRRGIRGAGCEIPRQADGIQTVS